MTKTLVSGRRNLGSPGGVLQESQGSDDPDDGWDPDPRSADEEGRLRRDLDGKLDGWLVGIKGKGGVQDGAHGSASGRPGGGGTIRRWNAVAGTSLGRRKPS